MTTEPSGGLRTACTRETRREKIQIQSLGQKKKASDLSPSIMGYFLQYIQKFWLLTKSIRGKLTFSCFSPSLLTVNKQ